jgi:hypothetical protein
MPVYMVLCGDNKGFSRLTETTLLASDAAEGMNEAQLANYVAGADRSALENAARRSKVSCATWCRFRLSSM